VTGHPALPADTADGQLWSTAEANHIYDHHEWWRDTRPLFKGRADDVLISSAVLVEIGHGGQQGFTYAATTDVGGFVLSSTVNSFGLFNLTAPTTGIYKGFWNVQFAAHATGYRVITPMKSGSRIHGSSVQSAATSAGVALLSAPFEVDCTTAGDTFSCQIWQNSGASNATSSWLSVWWVQST